MPRRSLTISAIRVTGRRKSIAILFMLSCRGVINSSRRISPGCTGFSFFAIAPSRFLVVIHDLGFIRMVRSRQARFLSPACFVGASLEK